MNYASAQRGQAEIIGLVIIVILITLGFLLYVGFTLSRETRTTNDYVGQTQLGQTLVNALATTDIFCGANHAAVEDLIRDVVVGRSVPCDAAREVETFFTLVLGQTLDVWGVNYRLFIGERDGLRVTPHEDFRVLTNPSIPSDERCSDTSDRTVDVYLIQLFPSPGQVELRLEQCP
ncbi:hypothetical protein D6789_04480 [Candidatus Woesearchaeota archaeon]|nr:MAG: hypothetical protein D6789_04480 [Candidatus Woesearchaeota archaeon]